MNQAAKNIDLTSTQDPIQHLIEQHLAMLISHDTCNPPREIAFTDPLFVALEAFFKGQGFTVTMADFGQGRVAFYALRGQPDVLFNVHLDTVPVSGGWTHDPFTLTQVDGRYFGRGVCDIKGAAACLMALAETAEQPMAVLFTTDEEGTNACCVEQFILDHDLSVFQQVVVAEPTGCQAVLQHRGYVSAHGQFSGISGHSSSVGALTGNAVHQASAWLQQATAMAATEQTADNPAGICFNLGYIQGGEKNNMIAEQCQLGFSVRVPAGQSSEQVYAQLIAKALEAQWHTTLMAPSLPENQALAEQSQQYCQAHDLPIGAPVDFWTEAALFSQAGVPALVLGPGDIAQAHTTDEWVAVAQLHQCYQLYAGLLS
ncbi:acetylornithine deacetylase [Marinicella meishanensis]|uniref:acetylornithine deacetylase n=1 Tax=Marinicella meishanensis TaxID=2873263 RepID=UPI001CBDEC35|nr:acetylornithine deacetylase [Marinicella sp. NBU2979]